MKKIADVLTLCKGSPNCVNTLDTRDEFKMAPLPFKEDFEKTKKKLMNVLKGFTEAKLVRDDGHVLFYEFTSRWLKFVDDVIFYLDDETKMIHFKSASRVGYYDFKKNRERMTAITNKYNAV